MRLQELTREIAGAPIPKQYCRLLHGSSLLEATVARAHLFAPRERINIVVNQNHLELAKAQLPALPESNVFVQPLNRDTGPGLIFALMQLEQTHPDAIVGVFPTDHYVDDDRAFIAHALRAVNTISRLPDKIAILGIAPDRPETGYGYIVPAGPLGISERAYHVQAFTEKPTLAAARSIIARGGLWNTFVMVFRLSRMIELLRQVVPDEFEKISELRESPHRAAELYRTLESWNLSTQVLARIPQHLILFEVADVRWSDWGTRESVERTYRALDLIPFWNLPRPVSSPVPG
jgi:mannose-1-phosphate guanylyltransferase